MSTLRYYLKNTQTNTGTGGIIYDLSTDVGSTTTLSSSNLNSTTFTEVIAWQQTVNNFINGTSFPFSINIVSTGGILENRYRLQRVNSSGVVQASSVYSSTYSTPGIYTGSFTLSTTWDYGDILRVSGELRRAGGHGNVSVTLTVNDSTCYVDSTVAYKNNFLLMF